MSIHAFGDLVRRGAGYVVEKLNSLASVDLVSEPGSTLSLFESRSLERICDHPDGRLIDILQFSHIGRVTDPRTAKARKLQFTEVKVKKLDKDSAKLLEALPLKSADVRREIVEAMASEPTRDEKRLLAAISKM